MRQKKTFITLLLITGILALSIAYAALASQTLSVDGSAEVEISSDNFDVCFTETHETTKPSGVTADITYPNEDTVNLAITGLTTKDQKVVSRLEIKNIDPSNAGVYAKLDFITIASGLEDWFSVEAELENGGNLAPGKSDYLIVTVTLKKTPITDTEVEYINDNGSILVSLEATPVQGS